MDTDDRLARVAVFVGVAVIVALVIGLVASLGSPGAPDTSVAYPNASDMLPDVVEASDEASEAEPIGGEPRVVVVDDTHGNRFDDDDIRPLLDSLGPQHEVVFTSRSQVDLETSLSLADAYVVIDPSFTHSREQVTAVESFVEDGGRVVLMGEPTRVDVASGPFGGSLVDVRSRLGVLGARLGVSFGTDYLYDEVNNEGNYKRVFADGRNDLDGARAALYTATTVEAPGGERLLVTPETTRLSAQSEARSRPVAVRTGNVIAVGDTTFLTGGKSVVADNERLVRTIASFAVGGDRSRSLADYPYFLPDEPRIRYTSGELLNATKVIAGDVRGTGRPATVSASTRSVAPRRTDVLVTTFDDLETTNVPETGIEVTATSVSVPGYEGTRDGVAVVHRPEGPIDLVIAASSRERAVATGRALSDGSLDADVLSDRTAVTVVQEAEEADEEGDDGTTDPPTGEEPAPPPTDDAPASIIRPVPHPG